MDWCPFDVFINRIKERTISDWKTACGMNPEVLGEEENSFIQHTTAAPPPVFQTTTQVSLSPVGLAAVNSTGTGKHISVFLYSIVILKCVLQGCVYKSPRLGPSYKNPQFGHKLFIGPLKNLETPGFLLYKVFFLIC